MNDFSKQQSQVEHTQEVTRRKKLPVYILIVVGLFLVALVIYMMADNSTNPTAQVILSHAHSLVLNS